MTLLLMCLEFFKTGLLSVGGGLATLPFLYEMADKYPWFTRAQLGDMIAVSESTPGPIGINMATYAGYCTAGIPGAVIATLGLITPSIIIILLIARALEAFRKNPYVEAGFYGLRPCSVGLIAAAGFGILKLALQIDLGAEMWISWKALGTGIVLAILYGFFGKKAHPIVFIGLGAAAGLVMGL